MVEFSEPPINKPKLQRRSINAEKGTIAGADLSSFMIDHNIVRLDISMHDTTGMTEVESLCKRISMAKGDLTPPY